MPGTIRATGSRVAVAIAWVAGSMKLCGSLVIFFFFFAWGFGGGRSIVQKVIAELRDFSSYPVKRRALTAMLG